MPDEAEFKIVEAEFIGREDLARYSDNAWLLFALETRFDIEDIHDVASSALTDGEDDRKCDLLFIERSTGTAVIAQAYGSSIPKPNPPANKAADLSSAASWILAPSDLDKMNSSLRSAVEELHDALNEGAIDSLELWYVHNLDESSDSDDELRQVALAAGALIRNNFPGGGDVDVRALQVGTRRLTEWFRRVTSQVLIRDLLEVPCPPGAWFEESGDTWRARSTSVPGSWLAGLHSRFGSEKLFSGNVRGDMPARKSASDINNGIQQTAGERPQDFWALNNGLTALVNKIVDDAKEESFSVEGITIVNGAQTTGALSRASDAGTAADDVRVAIRFIECRNADLIREISRCNNTQNAILPADFRSSDPVQQRLENEFLRIPGVSYRGPRRGGHGDRKNKPKDLLEADLAAQALAAFHAAPHVAYHRKNEIWRDNSLYGTYFSDHTKAPHIVFCVSLLRSIRELKSGLLRRVGQLTSDEVELLEFLRTRGADFNLASAIAGCIELYLGKPVTSTWTLNFGKDTSVDVGAEYWEPLVVSSTSFYAALAGLTSGQVRQREVRETALTDFRSRVNSTKQQNRAIFDGFAARVIV